MFYDATVEVLDFEDLEPKYSGAMAYILGSKHVGYIHCGFGDRYCLMKNDVMLPFSINDRIIILDGMEVQQ